MLMIYSVLAVVVGTAASVWSGRHGINAVAAALIAGLLWPLIVVGALQLAIWMAVAPAAQDSAPARPILADSPPAVL